MPKPKISYTELTHQVVHESPEPLPFAKIRQQVAAITPKLFRHIATKGQPYENNQPQHPILSAWSEVKIQRRAGEFSHST